MWLKKFWRRLRGGSLAEMELPFHEAAQALGAVPGDMIEFSRHGSLAAVTYIPYESDHCRMGHLIETLESASSPYSAPMRTRLADIALNVTAREMNRDIRSMLMRLEDVAWLWATPQLLVKFDDTTISLWQNSFDDKFSIVFHSQTGNDKVLRRRVPGDLYYRLNTWYAGALLAALGELDHKLQTWGVFAMATDIPDGGLSNMRWMAIGTGRKFNDERDETFAAIITSRVDPNTQHPVVKRQTFQVYIDGDWLIGSGSDYIDMSIVAKAIGDSLRPKLRPGDELHIDTRKVLLVDKPGICYARQVKGYPGRINHMVNHIDDVWQAANIQQ